MAVLCLSLVFTQAAGAETAAATGVAPEVQAKMASVQVPFVPNEGQVNDAGSSFPPAPSPAPSTSPVTVLFTTCPAVKTVAGC